MLGHPTKWLQLFNGDSQEDTMVKLHSAFTELVAQESVTLKSVVHSIRRLSQTYPLTEGERCELLGSIKSLGHAIGAEIAFVMREDARHE